jgi:hypothetical protein
MASAVKVALMAIARSSCGMQFHYEARRKAISSGPDRAAIMKSP